MNRLARRGPEAYAVHFNNFPLGQFIDKGIILGGGQAPKHKHIDKLPAFVREGRVKYEDIITYRLPLTKISDRYVVFKKREDNCVKVVMDTWAE